MAKDICIGCGKEFERDQYHFWCNECGEKHEKNWLEYVEASTEANFDNITIDIKPVTLI